jgi:hypothetical protein
MGGFKIGAQVMSNVTDKFRPGMVVEVTQQTPHGREVWATKTRGTVVKYEQAKTGSWFAHGKDDKLWLDRLTLRYEDGEIAVLNLDTYTHVELIDGSGLCDPT